MLERSDFDQLINWIESLRLMVQWGGPTFDFPLTADQLEKYIENANNADSDILIYKVVDKETEDVVGHIALGNINRKNETARIGKVLVGNKNVRNKGICQQMIKGILKIAFEDLHLHRISLAKKQGDGSRVYLIYPI